MHAGIRGQAGQLAACPLWPGPLTQGESLRQCIPLRISLHSVRVTLRMGQSNLHLNIGFCGCEVGRPCSIQSMCSQPGEGIVHSSVFARRVLEMCHLPCNPAAGRLCTREWHLLLTGPGKFQGRPQVGGSRSLTAAPSATAGCHGWAACARGVSPIPSDTAAGPPHRRGAV